MLVYGLPDGLIDGALWGCDYLNIMDVHLAFDWDRLDGYHGELVDYSLEDKSFVITIEESLDLRDSLIAIFHELYHVRQVMDGRLQFECGPTFWLGEEAEHGGEYGQLPWEKEAFFMEEILYKRYVQEVGEVIGSVQKGE